MCCPPGNILQRRHYLQYNFILHISNVTTSSYKEQSRSLCIQLYVVLLPTLCLMLGACGSWISKLRSRFRQPGGCFSSDQQGKLSHLAASGPLDLLQKDGRSTLSLWEGRSVSLWSERIWSDVQRWPQRFNSMPVPQTGAEGSDLRELCKIKSPSHGGGENL